MSSKCVHKAMEGAAYVPPPAMTQKVPLQILCSHHPIVLFWDAFGTYGHHTVLFQLLTYFYLYMHGIYVYMGNMALAWTFPECLEAAGFIHQIPLIDDSCSWLQNF